MLGHSNAMRSFLVLVVSSLFIGCASNSSHHDSHHRAPIPRNDHGWPVGCSWYCGAPPIEVTASNTLHDGIYSYDAANIHDFKKSTAWASSGSGIGTKITFTFDCAGEEYRDRKDNPFGIDGFSLINGFARSPELWATNGRVKTFKVSFNGNPKGTITVQDTASAQHVKLPDLTFPPGKKSRLLLEITDVYPGTTYEDTCIADIVFTGFGVH